MSGKKGKGAAKSAIHDAAATGDVEAITSLLATDCKLLSSKNGDGWTPLHSAAYNGEVEAVNALIAAGSDVNARCNDGDTPLHYASAQGEAEVISALAAAKARLEVADNDGETPIEVAQSKKIKTLLQSLIDKATADDDAADDDGEGEQEEDLDKLAAEIEAIGKKDAKSKVKGKK